MSARKELTQEQMLEINRSFREFDMQCVNFGYHCETKVESNDRSVIMTGDFE